MNSTLGGKVAIVTGAARGLGRAYALRLASLGADVAIADVDLGGAGEYGEELTADSVEAEISALGVRALAFQGDLTRLDNVQALFARVVQEFGRVDVVVNNAGGAIANSSSSMPSGTSLDDARLLFDVNYLSMLLCCQAAAPIMRQQRSGVIVNTASQTAVSPLRDGNLGVYGAAKAAVLQYSRALAAELGPDGIRVNCISPGIILTARVAAQAAARAIGTDAQMAAIPLGRFGNVEDCAGVVEFLATDLSRYVTGQCISVCGGVVLTPN